MVITLQNLKEGVFEEGEKIDYYKLLKHLVNCNVSIRIKI